MAKITTITNPLTGQPVQVDQLEHTAQQIDDGVNAAGIESTDYPGCYYRMVGGVVEWFNPPMLIGKEYRTTERYNGKPVYAVLCECDNFLTPGSIGTFTAKSNGEVISNVSDIVDFGGTVYEWYIPTFMFGGNFTDDDNTVQIEVRANAQNNIVILSYTKSRDLTSTKPIVWVKYIKTTG